MSESPQHADAPDAADAADAVDAITAQWHRERPDLDVAAIEVIGRISRLAAIIDDRLRRVFGEVGLGTGDFDVLASLRRSGAPFRLSPGALSATTMVTSGAVTKRVDRLATEGLVTRETSGSDGRARVVTLTDKGRRLVDEVHPRHLANEERLLGALDEGEREQLVRLLRKLLVDLDG